jgi:hypothetical protein
LAVYGKDTVDINTVHSGARKSGDNGGNVDLIDQLQSGRPFFAVYDLNRQKSQ